MVIQLHRSDKQRRIYQAVCIGGIVAAFILSACSSQPSSSAPSVGDTTADATQATTGGITGDPATAMPTTGGNTASATSAMPDATAGMGSEVSIANIAANPDSYLGQTVTVVSTPRELLGDRAFRLNDSDTSTATGATELLVVGATGAMVTDTMLNQPIKVTGIVTKLDLPALEQQLGVDLDDSLFANFVDQPVLVATSVEAA
jgi:hypothetical protein